MSSPWGLSPAEIQVMDLLTEVGTSKRVAKALNISVKTVEAHRYHVSVKMGGDSFVLRLLKWDRWRRENA